MIKMYDLTAERVKEPRAVKKSGVRFGWKLDSDEKDVMQTGYSLTVFLDGEPVWEKKEDTDEVEIIEEVTDYKMAEGLYSGGLSKRDKC